MRISDWSSDVFSSYLHCRRRQRGLGDLQSGHGQGRLWRRAVHMVTEMTQASLSLRLRAYRTIWRWHFYAGLFVIPFVLLLAVTGEAYLFKPQVERWEERAFQGLAVAGAAAPQRPVDSALAAFLGARLHSYRRPDRPGDAALDRKSA